MRKQDMNCFLACAGTNGNEVVLGKLLDLAKEKNPDAILFAGGIVNPDVNLTQKREFISKYFESLGKSGCSAILIPGPYDIPLGEFFRAAINAEVVFSNIFVVHATFFSKSNVGVMGLGGLLAGEQDSASPVLRYSHTSAEYFLRNLWHTDKPMKILLLSEPPSGKLAGERGNGFVDEFIKTYHPNICVVAGKTKCRGFDEEKHGFVVNPGQLSEMSAAWIDWPNRKIEMLDL